VTSLFSKHANDFLICEELTNRWSSSFYFGLTNPALILFQIYTLDLEWERCYNNFTIKKFYNHQGFSFDTEASRAVALHHLKDRNLHNAHMLIRSTDLLDADHRAFR